MLLGNLNCRDFHDLIGSARSVEIFAVSPSCSTFGSKAYFLFKLHDPTSDESGRQQQLMTRLSSCILDTALYSSNRRAISFLSCEGFFLTALFEVDLERFYSLRESHTIP